MEGKIQKLLVAGGLVMSAAVALIPLTSYAAYTPTEPKYAPGYDCGKTGGECANGNGTTEVVVNVRPTLALKSTVAGEDGIYDCLEGEECVTTDGKAVEIYPYKLVEDGNFSVTLRSAVPYTVSLSAEEPSLVNEDDDAYVIRPRADIATADGKNKNGWAVKQLNADKTPSSYLAVSDVPKVFFSTDIPTDQEANAEDGLYTTVTFPFGVSVTNSIPQGIYSTEVTITAAVKVE